MNKTDDDSMLIGSTEINCRTDDDRISFTFCCTSSCTSKSYIPNGSDTKTSTAKTATESVLLFCSVSWSKSYQFSTEKIIAIIIGLNLSDQSLVAVLFVNSK